MTLADILKTKGSEIFTIAPTATLEDAAREMVHRNVGSLVVCARDLSAGEQMLGIITERDVLRYCAATRGPLASASVADVMSARLFTGAPQDSVEATMGVMTAHRVRHLPVLSEGRLVGVVSIGDLVKSQHDRLAMENKFMKDYIAGE